MGIIWTMRSHESQPFTLANLLRLQKNVRFYKDYIELTIDGAFKIKKNLTLEIYTV